jgi:hypothetical protein
MQNHQTFRSAMTHPVCADRQDVATAGGHADVADLVAEARAIVAGADIRPTRSHLRACLSWLDGCPLQVGDATFEH